MGPPKRVDEKHFTYGDYLTWPEDERWEILEGVPVAMTPGPNPDHQRVSRKLCFQIERFLEGKPCEMFDAPIDLLLPTGDEADEETDTVLQPDIMVICDPVQVTKRFVKGGPEFVIEILSPSSRSHDQIRKRRLYEKHGVKEYWVIDPEDRLVTVFRRQNNPSVAGSRARPNGGKTRSQAGAANEPACAAGGFATTQILDANDLHLDVQVLPGLSIDFTRIFLPLPKVLKQSPAPYL